MVQQKLLFQAISLLSQYLTQIKEAKGELYQKTACLHPEERELIGIIWAIADFIENDDAELSKYLKGEIVPFIETIGIARWPRTELTDLGLRVGQRHQKAVDLADDVISEVDLAREEDVEG